MHIALSVQFGRDDQLIFCQQLGVDYALAQVDRCDEQTLIALKNRVERTGLRLAGIDGFVLTDLETAQRAVAAAAAASIDLISCTGIAQPSSEPPQPIGRGGALSTPYNAPEIALSEEELRALARTAEDAGVRLAWSGFDALPGMGFDLSLDRLGDDPTAALDALAAPVYIARARNIQDGNTSFLDEGDVHIPRAIRALQRSGFSGPLLAHIPLGMAGDTEWGHKARAYDLGYLKAALQALQVR
jgi:hypothetical protein